jgi:hypothetical protein
MRMSHAEPGNGHKERSSSYERALREKSHIIRETEMRSMNRKERSKPEQRFDER